MLPLHILACAVVFLSGPLSSITPGENSTPLACSLCEQDMQGETADLRPVQTSSWLYPALTLLQQQKILLGCPPGV